MRENKPQQNKPPQNKPLQNKPLQNKPLAENNLRLFQPDYRNCAAINPMMTEDMRCVFAEAYMENYLRLMNAFKDAYNEEYHRLETAAKAKDPNDSL
jgi:hypothetical protein